MKSKYASFFSLAVIASFITAGCHGQQPVTPPQSTCQPAGSYTAINGVGSSNPPTTSTTFVVTNVTTQTCFLAQGYLPPANGVIGQYGAFSNVVGPTIGGATNKVQLAVTCSAGAGQTCSGVEWVFFSAPAVTALAPGAPSVGAPTQSKLLQPSLSPQPTIASNMIGGIKLRGSGL